MKRYIAILLTGIFIGATVINLLYGNIIDKLYWEKEELKIRLFETTERLDKLEDQLETHQNPVVREVIIEIIQDKNSFTELSLRQAIGEIVTHLVGEELNDLNPYLIHRMIDGRNIKLDEGELYRVEVIWIIISEQIIFHLSCSPLPPD